MTERNVKRRGKAGRDRPADGQAGAATVDLPWSVPVGVAEVPELGRHVDLAPDQATRQAIVRLAKVVALPRLEASFELTRRGADGLHVEGRVSATVVQNCVVTLEPVESEVYEPVDLVFRPEPGEQPASQDDADAGGETGFHALDGAEPPETLVGGTVDLGMLATEFLLLGIDPYPRKEGAVFDAPPVGDPVSRPFAALAALKKDRDPNSR